MKLIQWHVIYMTEVMQFHYKYHHGLNSPNLYFELGTLFNINTFYQYSIPDQSSIKCLRFDLLLSFNSNYLNEILCQWSSPLVIVYITANFEYALH